MSGLSRRRARHLGIRAALTLLATLTACSDGTPDAGTPDADTAVALGVDVLFRDSVHVLAGRRVGLITNHTGVSWPADPEDPATTTPPGTRTPDNAVSTIDRLYRHPAIDLVALFSPEHGIRGEAGAGDLVDDDVDAATGLPIGSLYGATRKPTPEMLADIDVLVFDIQDIGARYYTYVWTMALAMEAAGEAGIGFVVLDRPNPIGGEHVQGNTLDPEFATFVGLYPVPMRHGLTVGELARMLVGEYGIDVDLTVVPVDGWSRREWWVQTGLPFIPPSPNMPSVASATHYPGTCLFEGTNLSVGRGTDRPFQWIGAPWLDAEAVAERVDADLAATTFTPRNPGDGKYDGQALPAVEFVMMNPGTYDPIATAVSTLKAIHDLHPDQLEWNVAHFDRLAGTSALREGILAGQPLEELTGDWEAEQAEFRRRREPYLLY